MTDYAHIKQTDTGWATQSISEHCQGTADLAEAMAEAFDAGPWARLCGLWHDMGKYSDTFQQHIIASSGYHGIKDPGKTDHATAGTLWSMEQLKGHCLPIAYCISGHHSGLMDFDDNGRQTLKFHLSSQEMPLLDAVRSHIPPIKIPQLPHPSFDRDNRKPKDWHLWIRMLFSCLVDADWLDTEKFMNPEEYHQRTHFDKLQNFKPLLDQYLKDLAGHAHPSEVNEIRSEVQNVCRRHGSSSPQGIYSLTVPTGGGKTLSSLLWAMEHAKAHHLERIIIAIPYTSIVSQTADTLRGLFGSNNVVEHQCYADFDKLPEKDRRSLKLATENWDAPIIVTTNVQLFESLFSNKTSRCRKLHNIAKSVLILDEVQMLPVENLQPITDILDGLAKYMHTSILLTTATQPALSGKIGSGDTQFEGLNSKEIILDKESLFNKMRRVDIQFYKESTTIELLANELSRQSQVLCVVNSRREAQELFNALPDKSHAYHLSRMMCQQHISDQLDTIRKRLHEGESVQVISTQLIEAGVDIDFPSVWREMAGLDSIAQAAGRCNREGRQKKGIVHVFQIEGARMNGLMAKARDAALDLLSMGKKDFLSPSVAEDYFRHFYAKANSTDKDGITDALYRQTPQFAEAADKFKMIDDNSLTVYVPYKDGEKWLSLLKKGVYTSSLLRHLQRYSVNVYPNHKTDIEQIGAQKLGDYVYALPDCTHYSEQTGIIFDNPWLENDLII